jgi:hypothetical protein
VTLSERSGGAFFDFPLSQTGIELVDTANARTRINAAGGLLRKTLRRKVDALPVWATILDAARKWLEIRHLPSYPSTK